MTERQEQGEIQKYGGRALEPPPVTLLLLVKLFVGLPFVYYFVGGLTVSWFEEELARGREIDLLDCVLYNIITFPTMTGMGLRPGPGWRWFGQFSLQFSPSGEYDFFLLMMANGATAGAIILMRWRLVELVVWFIWKLFPRTRPPSWRDAAYWEWLKRPKLSYWRVVIGRAGTIFPFLVPIYMVIFGVGIVIQNYQSDLIGYTLTTFAVFPTGPVIYFRIIANDWSCGSIILNVYVVSVYLSVKSFQLFRRWSGRKGNSPV